VKRDHQRVLSSNDGYSLKERPIFKYFQPKSVVPSQQTSSAKAKKVSKWEILDKLLDWLVIEQNYRSVYDAQKSKVGVKVETSNKGWLRAAVYINSHTGSNLNGEAVRGGAGRHRKKYFQVAGSANKTGAGVTNDTSATDFDEELEAKCYGFEKTSALFGKNPHVRPACELKTGSGVVKFLSEKMNVTVQRLNSGNVGGTTRLASAAKVVSVDRDSMEYSENQKDLEEAANLTEMDSSNYSDDLCNSDDDNNLNDSEDSKSSTDSNNIDDLATQEYQHDQNVIDSYKYQHDAVEPPHHQGEAFINYRCTTSSITASVTSSKRQRLHERPISSKGGRTSTTSTERTKPPRGIHDQPSRKEIKPGTAKALDELVNQKTKVELKMQTVRMEHDREMEDSRRLEAQKSRDHDITIQQADLIKDLILKGKSDEIQQAIHGF
ncbi:hypothetical protein BGX24_005529, partial [Mortierella sp. AD032]